MRAPGAGGGAGYVFEYRGSAIRNLNMANRMTICNMSIEGGARAGEVMVVHGARSLFGPESRAASVRRVAAPDGVFGFGASLAGAG